MNYYYLIASILGFSISAGHFTIGKKLYLMPMMKAEFDSVAKRTMICVFHYISVFLVLSSIWLLALSFNSELLIGQKYISVFIAENYVLFAFIQIIVGFTSEIDKWYLKMFQWILFLSTAAFCLLGFYS